MAVSTRMPRRPRDTSLGSCPACGHAVAADAGALPYRGRFYHLVCALWHREWASGPPAATG